MKNIILSFLLLTGCEFKEYKPVNKVTKTYEIICKHPLGHIESFKVDELNFRRPSNFRGGLWSFRTVDGVFIRSSNCHTSSKSVQIKQ